MQVLCAVATTRSRRGRRAVARAEARGQKRVCGMDNFDAIVIGAGVIGCSVAYHLAHFGAKRVLVLDRGQIGTGTTSQSSGILRTHYTVPENVELALASWRVFRNFAAIRRRCRCIGRSRAVRLSDRVAGRTQARGAARGPRRSAPPGHHGAGTRRADRRRSLLPIARFDDAALIGYRTRRGVCRPVSRRQRVCAFGAANAA